MSLIAEGAISSALHLNQLRMDFFHQNIAFQFNDLREYFNNPLEFYPWPTYTITSMLNGSDEWTLLSSVHAGGGLAQ